MEFLAEMGLMPLWQRRERSLFRRPSPTGLETVAAAEVSSTGVSLPIPDRPEKGMDDDGNGTDRAARIAALDWERLRANVATCRACRLCEQRTQAVLGVGDRQADWLFIGEGPGAEEDARGEPFVGAAGRLLDAMLAALDLRRGKEVYIANAVKCRPPNNRTPEAREIAACLPFLRRQIALLRPRVMVLLGRAAAHAVLGEVGSLGSLRGQSLYYRRLEEGLEIPVVVTYHPAYLLRTLPEKAKSWEDLCRARALMRAAKTGAGQGGRRESG